MTRAAPLRLGLVAALVMAGCGSAQLSPGTTSPSPDGCALTTQPSPADEPPRGGEELIDTANWGGGRWRLCLAEPLVASAEGTLWCTWTADRSAVLELNPRPVRIGALDYEVWLSFQMNKFEFHAMDLRGTIANYEPGAAPPTGVSTDGGRSGALTFDAGLVVDPESGPPPGAPPRHGGAVSWTCADPPPPPA